MEDKQLEKFIRRYEAATARLIEAERELVRHQSDQYVTWEWVCWYLNVGKPVAERMLAEQNIFMFAKGIERFLKSDIIQFAQRNKVKVYERAVFFLTKTPAEKLTEAISDSASRNEEIRDKAARSMMQYVADTDKRIAKRKAFEEKKLLKNQPAVKTKSTGKGILSKFKKQ